jgi:flagellar biosynthesis protein FliQ
MAETWARVGRGVVAVLIGILLSAVVGGTIGYVAQGSSGSLLSPLLIPICAGAGGLAGFATCLFVAVVRPSIKIAIVVGIVSGIFPALLFRRHEVGLLFVPAISTATLLAALIAGRANAPGALQG